MNDAFNEKNFHKLMEGYSKLTLEKQREYLINDLKLILSINFKLCESVHVSFDMMYYIKEMFDLNQEKASEKEFLEVVYSYLFLIKASSNIYMNSCISLEGGNMFDD